MTKKILLLFSLSLTFLQAQTLVMETGQVNITHTITSVSFTNTFTDPIVIATPSTYNGSHEATVRIDNVTGLGFDLYIEEPVNRDGPHTTETIHWIVVEKGMYTFSDGTMIEAGELSSSNLSFQTVGLLQTYAATPAIFTQVQTDNSSTQFLKTRQNNSTTTNFQVKLEREESLNSLNPGGAEDIGYIAITKGGGVIDGITIEANSFTSDHNIVTNIFSESFSAGNHFVASISTTNGGDPSNLRWTSFSATQVSLFIDEDISSDGETNHINETIDYFVIDDNGSAGIFLASLLPIELFSFDAVLNQDRTVKVDWITSSELNNDYFTVERSIDGQNWEAISKVNGAGNSSTERTYSVVDANPYRQISYYRLKQTDYDGAYSYSQIRIINDSKLSANLVNLYPNPAVDQITIEANKTELESLLIYNSLGQALTQQVLILESNSTNKCSIDLSNLEIGVYFLKTKSTTKKFYKTN